MARKSSTLTSNSRDNESDPLSGNSDDPGSNISGDVPSAQGAGDAAPPVKRRKRGPNKPKPGIFTVHTKACMKQDEIVKLLTAQAVTMLGAEVAANMLLQINIDGKWQPLIAFLGDSALQFTTVEKS